MFFSFLHGFPASSQLLSSPWFLPGFLRVSSTSRTNLWLPRNLHAPVSSNRVCKTLPELFDPSSFITTQPFHNPDSFCFFSPALIPRSIPSHLGECSFCLFVFSPVLLLLFIKSPFGLYFPSIFVCLVCLGLPTGPPPVLGITTCVVKIYLKVFLKLTCCFPDLHLHSKWFTHIGLPFIIFPGLPRSHRFGGLICPNWFSLFYLL